MAQIIPCPACNCRLSLADASAGKRVVCPKCKHTFAVEAPEARASSEEDFFAALTSGSAPATAPRKPAAAAAPASKASATAATPAAGGLGPSKNRKGAGKNQIPQEWIIGGAIGAGVLLLLIIAIVAISSGGKPRRQQASGGKENVKWGLKESQRARIYYELIEAVDRFGVNPAGKQRWRAIMKAHNINDQVTAAIMDEGSVTNWRQPDVLHGADASCKTNRHDWTRLRLETHREPMLN